MSVLEDRVPAILARLDLSVEVERRAGAGRVNGGRVTFRCPHPDHPDNTPSFTVDTTGPNAGTWRCWSRCGASGDLVDLVCWLDGMTKAQAIEALARQVGLERAPMVPTESRSEAARLPPQAWDVVRSFVAERGWLPDVVDELGIRPAIVRGHLVVRFPLRRAGVEVSYQDRQLGGRTPKWLNPPGPIPCPYEADRIARAHEVGELIVCEGIADTVALLSNYPDAAVIGCPGAGTFKRHWAKALTGLSVFVVADNDAAGAAMRERMSELVGPVADVRHALVPEPHHDLDDWRRAAGEAWPDEIAAALAVASSEWAPS